MKTKALRIYGKEDLRLDEYELPKIKDDEILLYRVRDIDTSRTLWQRLFGVGTVTVISSDKTMPTMVLKNVKDPVFVKELIHKQVEEMKIQRRVRLNELMTPGADADGDLDPDEDPDEAE